MVMNLITAPETKRDGSVQSVERALSILVALSFGEDGRRLSDVAREISLPTSTVHRLLVTLEKCQFVQFERTQGTWHIGRRAYSVGESFTKRHNIVASAFPALRELRDRTQETVNLGVLENGKVLTIAQIRSRQVTRTISRVGDHTPTHNSGLGKAILSTYSSNQMTQILAIHPVRRHTKNTICSKSALEHNLIEARQRGFALDNEEYVSGVRCVAVPIANLRAIPPMAVSVSGSVDRISQNRLDEISALIHSTTDRLAETLGNLDEQSLHQN